MLPPPDKHELEMEVDGCFRNGDKGNVARLIHKDSSTISRQLSPNQEHNNHIIYFFILVLWAFDCIRQELGDAVIEIVLRERSKWLCQAPEIMEHPATLTKCVGVEYVEAIEAEMLGHSINNQIREWGDVITTASRKQQALIQSRADQYNSTHKNHAQAAVSRFKKERAA